MKVVAHGKWQVRDKELKKKKNQINKNKPEETLCDVRLS